MTDFARLVLGWETFYLLTRTAAATLIGLLFVAISVGRETVGAKATQDLALFGALTFNCFFYVLVISILFLIPELGNLWLGLLLALLAGLALIGTVIQWRQAVALPPNRIGTRISARFGAPLFALGMICATGLLTVLGDAWSLYGLVVAIILLLASASQNAWALLMLQRA